MPVDLTQSHAAVFDLQREMKIDSEFEARCKTHGLPWDFKAGYEPRWYNGPPPAEVQVLVLMAEPGAITPTEALNLMPAITQMPWVGPYDLRLQEHYWRENLRELCRYIWPSDTEANMLAHLGGSCTFWMSLPPGVQTSEVPGPLVKYFSNKYLMRFLRLFPNAAVIAAGKKAQDRLGKLGVAHHSCWAFTRPGCNQSKAHDSWREAGLAVAALLKPT